MTTNSNMCLVFNNNKQSEAYDEQKQKQSFWEKKCHHVECKSQLLPCILPAATCTETPVCPSAGSGVGITALPTHGGWHFKREVRVKCMKPQVSSCALAPFGLVCLTYFSTVQPTQRQILQYSSRLKPPKVHFTCGLMLLHFLGSRLQPWTAV